MYNYMCILFLRTSITHCENLSIIYSLLKYFRKILWDNPRVWAKVYLRWPGLIINILYYIIILIILCIPLTKMTKLFTLFCT